MKSKIDLVIFDMDGLMIDTESIAMKAFYSVMWNKYQLKVEDHFFYSLIGTPTLEMEGPIKRVYGKEFPFQEFIKDYSLEKDKIIERDGISVKKGLVCLLQYLENKGIRKVVATSTIRSIAEQKLTYAGVESYFEYYVCGDEVTQGKPNPEIFLKAAEKASVLPERALVLEDSINGIKAAHQAGIPCVFIKDLVEPSTEVLSLVTKRFEDLSQVISLFEQ